MHNICNENHVSIVSQCISFLAVSNSSATVAPGKGKSKVPLREEGRKWISGYDIREVEEKGPSGSRIKGGKPQAESGRGCCSIFLFKPESREQDIDKRGLLEAEGLWLCFQMGSREEFHCGKARHP